VVSSGEHRRRAALSQMGSFSSFSRKGSTHGKVREGEVVGRGSQRFCVILDSLAPGPKLHSSTGKTKGCNEQTLSFLEHSLAAQVLPLCMVLFLRESVASVIFVKYTFSISFTFPGRLFLVPHIDLAPWKPSQLVHSSD